MRLQRASKQIGDPDDRSTDWHQTLRSLERDGLVSRRVTPSVPVRVDYELTPLGFTLMPLIRHMKDWAECHMDKVATARESYDAGQ